MKKPQESIIVPLNRGRIPPQAVDMEVSVLGTLLVYDNAIFEVIDILFPNVFYRDGHQYIYEAIFSLFNSSEPIDLLTVSRKLRQDGNLEKAGGDSYLIGLTQKVTSSAHVEYNARIILQKYIAREMIKTFNRGIEAAYDEGMDVFDLLDESYNSIADVTEKTMQPSDIPFIKTMNEEIATARNVYEKKVIPGILSPIENLNKTSGGWRTSELIILAARPGMGKTALAINFATHCALSGDQVDIYSLEMSRAQLVKRILASISMIHGDKWTKYGISPSEEISVRSKQDAWNRIDRRLHIDDSSSLSIEKLRVKAKISHKKRKTKLIIVDYLQLMSGNTKSNRNREQEIATISRGIKEIAKDLNIPVIALSQLSRSVETRGGSKRPGLADLRESGAIEQDADMVMFIYRPEYYKIDEWDDDERAPTHGQAEWIIGKNRNGGLGDGRMQFKPEYSLFKDLDDDLFSKSTLVDENNLRVVPDYDAQLGEKDDSDVPF